MDATEKQNRESGEAPRAEQREGDGLGADGDSPHDVPDEHVIERTLPQKPKDET